MAGELALARSKGKITTGQQDVNSNNFGKSGTFFKRLQAEAQDSIRTHGGGGDAVSGSRGGDKKKQPKSSSYKL